MDDGVPIGNLLLLAAVVIAPTLIFWMLVRTPKAVDAIGARIRRHRRGPEPVGPPIERLTADLRRVHRAIASYPPGTPALRRRATHEAYDALLVQACAVVEVPQRLDTLPEGMDREVERLRVAEALKDAGITLN